MFGAHAGACLPKAFVTCATFALLGYAAICAWLYFNQRSLVYFPQGTRDGAAPTDFSIDRDGVVLRGWIANPGKSHAILYFGGNAERVEAMRDAASTWFPDASAYLVAYRGYGASDDEPSEATLLPDALALYDAVQARHPAAPIDVVGRSLGTGVATYVAAHRPVARLALVTPFDSLADVGATHYPWLPVRWLATERYPSVDWLPRHRGAVLVLQAGRDEVIPAASTRHLIEAAAAPPRVVVFPNADHNSISGDPQFGRELATFLRRQRARSDGR